MEQNSFFHLSLTQTVISLEASVLSQTNIATEKMVEQRQLHFEKALLHSRFPKCSYKDKEDFISWYNDVTSIISLAAWTEIYDKKF